MLFVMTRVMMCVMSCIMTLHHNAASWRCIIIQRHDHCFKCTWTYCTCTRCTCTCTGTGIVQLKNFLTSTVQNSTVEKFLTKYSTEQYSQNLENYDLTVPVPSTVYQYYIKPVFRKYRVADFLDKKNF